MLYSGIIQVIEDLCREGPYQAQYLRHAPCMKRVREDYQQCSTEYQERLRMVQQKVGQTSSQELEVLCCSFQTYLSCSQRVVDRTCGRKTARFTSEFLDRMTAPLAQGQCQTYTSGSVHCRDLPVKYRSTSTSTPVSSSVNLLKASLLVFFTFILH